MTHATSPDCRNCGASAPHHYCPSCGQETALHPPTLGEFVHEFVAHYIAIDGPLMRSLAMLLFAPGRLTSHYLAGRKRRYVLPLRLYLTISIVVWLSIAALHATRLPKGTFAEASLRDVSIFSFGLAKPRVEIHNGVFSCTGLPDKVCTRLQHRYDVPEEQLRKELNKISANLLSYLTYAMFAVVGLFALLAKLVFRKSGRNYGEHLVFAFHVHAMGLVSILLAGLLPPGFLLPIAGYVFIYLLVAVRHVYGLSWLRSAFATAFIGLGDMVLVLVATGVAALVSALI
jgi:hypothetical protein